MTRGLVVVLALTACGPGGGPKGECKDSLVVGDLVITEVFADFKAPAGGTGADEGKEWFEIYNASDRPIELEGLRIDHSRPDDSRLESHVMAAVTIAPGQYFTLGNAAADLVPAYIDYGYAADLGDFFNSDGGKLRIACGDTEIDSANYESVKSGASRQLTGATFPDYTLNDDQANWCEAADTEFEDGNLGTPGSESDCTPLIIGACNDNGTMRDTVPPQPGQLVITEVMVSPRGDDPLTEWFEAKALADFDLNGLTLDRVGDAGDSDTIESPDCISVTAGEYVVFAHNADMAMNNLPAGVVPKGIFGFALVGTSMTATPDVTILSGGTVIDSVTWSTAPATGASLTLNPTFEDDAVANDTESNFCDATSVYFPGATGGPNDDELGTPGAANDACPATVPPGSCNDEGNIRPIVPPVSPNLVITEIMPSPLVATTSGEWFEVTNVGGASFDLIGLGLDRAGDNAAPTVIGGTDCLALGVGEFAVFARNATPANNGGLPSVTATFGFGLLNTNGNVQVVDPATCELVAPFACTGIFDNVAYTTPNATTGGTAGVSAQLKLGMITTTANDTFANFCPGTVVYGEPLNNNKGTPGAASDCP